MAVSVTCPGCRTSYPVTEDLLGKKIRCKKCQETFTAAAARSPAAARAADQRITTARPAAAKGGNGRYDDEDDDAPRRNGNGRAPARQPAAKKGGNGLVIGAVAGGVLLLAAGVGIGVMLLKSDDTDATNTPDGGTPAVAAVTVPKTAPSTTTATKPSADKPAAAGGTAEMKMADAPDKLTIVRNMPRPADFRHDVVERAKKSAVWITTTTRDGGAWGSGWVAERHGNEAYIVTNAHVVDMKEPAKPPPEKLDICFDAGLPTERHYDGKLLGLDREEDLAVVRVKGKDLPDALKISPSYDLVESQRLLTLGFPFGGRLVKELQRGLGTGELKTTLRTRPSVVTGRIFNKDGSVKYISAEGGVDGGNSGGAVIDTNGNVCCVVVAGSTASNMRFFIPSEYVIHLLLGRVLTVVPGQALASGGGARQPITAAIADPLQRLRRVDAEVWAGPRPDEKKGDKPIRPGGDRQPPPQDGDGPVTTATLAYDANKRLNLGESHLATADLTLPPVTDKQVYWFRPHYYAKDGTERWGEAVVLEMGRFPVEAKTAQLAIKRKPDLTPADARRLEIDARQKFGFELEGLISGGYDQALKATLTERVAQVERNGDAKVQLQYLDLHLADSDTDNFIRRRLKGVLEAVKGLRARVTVTPDGRYKSPVPDFTDVPQGARGLLRQFNAQVIDALEVMALGLPGRDAQPGETWTRETEYTFPVEQNFQNSLFRLTCKYVGTRVRDGRQEAVIEIVGTVVKNNSNNDPNRGDRSGGRGGRGRGPVGGDGPGDRPPGDTPSPGGTDSLTDEEGDLKVGLHGFTRGAALVDVATGHVTLARTEADLAVVFPVTVKDPENNRNEVTVKAVAGVYLDITLHRSLNRDPPKAVDVAAVLPNQAKVYRPLVGVGEPAVGEATLSSTPLFPERGTLMPQDVWDKVRHSAVMLSVERNDGGGEGSGWFAEPGIIVTNCHVVGMLSKADRPPEKITVYLDRGTDQERKLTGELLAVNREDDLAVVRVKADRLPDPLKISPSATLVESDRLSVLGFPRGSSLAKEVEIGLGARDLQTTLKARPTTVTGRILNADGSVKFVSLEGGADPGNSGGAIADAKGEVRAVLVAGKPGTELRFGIPSEYAARMVQGYPLEVLPGRAYLDGSVPKQPIEIRFSDPMARVSAVAIDYWVGGPGKPRKPAEAKPEPAPGDGPRQTVTLTFKPGDWPGERLAVGEFVLPDVAPGRVCWLQPRYTNGTGKEQWGRSTAYAPDGPPVERKPATLAVQYRKGTRRDVELTSYTRLYSKQFVTEKHEGLPVKTTFVENVLAVSRKTGTATVNLEYQDLEMDLKKIFPGLDEVPRQVENALTARLRPFLSLIRGVVTVVDVHRDGRMKLRGLTYGRLPAGAQPQMHQFNTQILASLQAVTFPLPGREVPYGYTWEFPTDLFITSANRSDGAVFNMKFKYVGVRDRGGRQEAVVEITGSLAGKPDAKGIEAADEKDEPEKAVEPSARRFDDQPATALRKRKKGLYGVARGYAFVDVRDGFVAEVKLFIDLDVEMTSRDTTTKQDVPVDAGGTMELLLRRRTAQVK